MSQMSQFVQKCGPFFQHYMFAVFAIIEVQYTFTFDPSVSIRKRRVIQLKRDFEMGIYRKLALSVPSFPLYSLGTLQHGCFGSAVLIRLQVHEHEYHAQNKSDNPQSSERQKRNSINKPTAQRNPIDNYSSNYVQPNKQTVNPER
jgi:hypothetical protein